MHILVVNDDGPPSSTASPYILSLVRCLQNAGHVVSVVLPHIQRSWIGKAHFIGQLITPTYYQPPAPTAKIDSGTTHEFPLPKTANIEEWVLVDGTPATCTQLGLNHFFRDRGPIDLVLSGPNYGRNTTSLFALSSGTLGGALEAVAFRKRAIALSYAFFSRELDQNVLDVTSKQSVKVIEYLVKNWGDDVEVYSVNVPLVVGVDTNKIFFTDMLENYWSDGCAFDEVEAEDSTNEGQQAAENEREVREQTSKEDNSESKTEDIKHARHKHRHFKWAPKFADVHRSVEQSKPGNDGWAIRQGYTSITPLRASFTAAKAHRYGEVNLEPCDSSVLEYGLSKPLTTVSLYIHVAYEDPYVQPFIIQALRTLLVPGSYLLVNTPPGIVYLSRLTRYLQISSYELLPHETLLSRSEDHFGNSYIIRKALIRKHYLSHTIASWVAKNPGTPLKEHVPLTLDFELDYAEFLDDALVEAWEVKEAWERNLDKPHNKLEWWILKPSMSDKGQGIRLFSSQEQLQEIFDQWEAENPTDSEEEDDSPSAPRSQGDYDSASPEDNEDGLMISQLRHFIIQPYLPPLLIPSLGNRKFHIRSYVLAIGALKVYVYNDSLALHSAYSYTPPTLSTANLNLESHLTNTAIQTPNISELVYPLSSLPPTPTKSGTIWTPQTAQQQIHELTASLFRAAAAQPTTFQPLPNCFEVFGVDWLVDEDGKTWLLEVNAFPDFRQTGAEFGERIVGGFWKGVVAVITREWFAESLAEQENEEIQTQKEEFGEYVGLGMYKVLDLDMGRK